MNKTDTVTRQVTLNESQFMRTDGWDDEQTEEDKEGGGGGGGYVFI